LALKKKKRGEERGREKGWLAQKLEGELSKKRVTIK